LAKDVCRNITDEGILSVGGNGTVSFVNASDEGTKSYRWYQMLEHNGICNGYYENSDKSDVGTWRVPTLCELGILYTQGKLGKYYLCCSRSHFTVIPQIGSSTGYIEGYKAEFPYEFFGYYSGDRRIKQSVMMNATGSIHVRCVKDVR
jgi:hypothetical protein